MNINILLVDDDNNILNLFNKYLKNLKFLNTKLYYASNYKNFLDLFNRNPYHFDCFFIDINLDELEYDGFEVIKEIRKTNTYAFIVVISGIRLKIEDFEKAKMVGANDFLIKSDVDFLEQIGKLIGISKKRFIKIEKKRCVGCQTCVNTCPLQGIVLVKGKAKCIIQYDLCRKCLDCKDACPEDAISKIK